MLKLKIFLISFWLLSACEPSSGETKGTLREFYQGDLWHLDLKDETGEIHTFICQDGCDEFETSFHEFIGKKAKISWSRKELLVPSGEKLTFKITTKIELMKNKP